MKMENFTLTVNTQLAKMARMSLMLVGFMLFTFGSQAQCPLGCNNNVQVSLDSDCEALITPDMILEGPGGAACTYVVTILDQNDVPISTSPTVNSSHIGMTLKARVTLGDNSCWGYITVEDKLAPVLSCLDDVVMNCNDEVVSNAMTAFSSSSYSNSTAAAIPDGGSVDIPFAVSGANQLAFVENFNANLSLSHSVSTAQIVISFISPAGDTYTSLSAVPGAQNLNGNWIVRLTDNVVDGFGGTFTSGTISISARGFLASSETYNENCGSATVEKTSDTTDDVSCGDLSYPTSSARRTVCYQATDPSGNVSSECCFTIDYQRRPLSAVVFPDDVELSSCTSTVSGGTIVTWDQDNDFYPDPFEGSGAEEIGGPTIDGNPILVNDGFCEINVTYSDTRIDVCYGTFKVLRNWVALDWCTGAIRNETQIIKVLDDDLFVTCPLDATEFFLEEANPYTCTADHTVIPPIVISECGSWTYTVEYLIGGEAACDVPPPTGPFVDTNVDYVNGEYVIRDLPFGCTWIRYIVEDECGNVTECRREIRVIDTTPPTPVCDETTVVTLTNNGWAHIFAPSFDDGSHDNCSSEVTFLVDRMTAGCSTGSGWKEYEQFCCADVGKDIMVALLVTDSNGNSNSCMVTVHVQDKIDPTITCPPDMTVDCAGQTGVTYTGMATGTDNCGNPTITHSDSGSLNNCGQGTITRTWRAEDAGGRSVTCTQRIHVIDQTLFSGNSIGWPSDRTLSGCMNVDTDPSNPLLGYPTYNDDACSLIAHTYNDQVFNFVDGACSKILRTWTVIDWCQYDQNNPLAGGIWQRVQVIKVNNSVAPVFSNCSTLNFCIYGENCSGSIDLIGQATDECTPTNELSWRYQIKLDGQSNYGSIKLGNDASGTYSPGTHMIRWFVEDQCGNETECIQTFIVRDCKNPTPYCLSGITTVVMPSTDPPQIEIWASDFDLGSFDNCPGDLRFSFSSNVSNTNMTFTCDDLGIQQVEIWVTDAAGNQDYCETMIDIQANNGACPTNSAGAVVSGLITTEDAETVADVEVMLEDMINGSQSYVTTQANGEFVFNELSEGMDYELSASRNDDYMNGVSTLDLVLIQKHILQVTQLDSPYKVIAADVNNNGDVSAIDLIELRKLILGIFTELPNNDSWRFVDADQAFTDNSSPFPFIELIDMPTLTSDQENNYIAVKIGDVNGNVVANFSNEVSENRNANTTQLFFDEVEFVAGENVSLTLSSADFNEIVGLQYTLNFNNEVLEFANLENGNLSLNETNLGLNRLSEGKMTTSWNTLEGVNLDESDVLYTINFTAKTNGRLSDNVSMSSDLTNAEAYNSGLQTNTLTLNLRGETLSINEFKLGQNKPNPFSQTTNIEVVMPNAMTATLSVFDITGKTVNVVTQEFHKGVNTITLDTDQIPASGVLYYRLDAGEYTATKKMIVLKN